MGSEEDPPGASVHARSPGRDPPQRYTPPNDPREALPFLFFFCFPGSGRPA